MIYGNFGGITSTYKCIDTQQRDTILVQFILTIMPLLIMRFKSHTHTHKYTKAIASKNQMEQRREWNEVKL